MRPSHVRTARSPTGFPESLRNLPLRIRRWHSWSLHAANAPGLLFRYRPLLPTAPPSRCGRSSAPAASPLPSRARRRILRHQPAVPPARQSLTFLSQLLSPWEREVLSLKEVAFRTPRRAKPDLVRRRALWDLTILFCDCY